MFHFAFTSVFGTLHSILLSSINCICFREYLTALSGESKLAELSRRYLFVGKDYENWIFKDADDLHIPEEGEFSVSFPLKCDDTSLQQDLPLKILCAASFSMRIGQVGAAFNWVWKTPIRVNSALHPSLFPGLYLKAIGKSVALLFQLVVASATTTIFHFQDWANSFDNN